MSDIKILIVEDEAIVAEDIASRLENLGYHVEDIVASGEEAIAVAGDRSLDLVLMDIMLQGKMDGIEAAQNIRAQHRTPVIYLTANADDTTLQRAKITGSFGYVLKPFKEKELKATIEIALSRHQTEMQMQQALALSESLRQKEQQLGDLKSQFVAMVSHEFRTPLSVIKIAAEILQHYDDRLSLEKKQRHFERIQTATDNMSQLLEDVLMLEQADRGKLSCICAPLNVVYFCRDLIEALQWTASGNCQLEFINRAGELEVNLDERLLWQLFSNLLSNAIKYSPNGGTVSLILFCQDENLCFEVQDQGIGIPPADQQHLFEPFQRAANVGKIPGTGLGLTIAKRAADLQGGQISVVSEVDRGTTFTVAFPLSFGKPPLIDSS